MTQTISSREQFPVRSPSPLTQQWTVSAPHSTACRVLATARPKSLWVWISMGRPPVLSLM